jgi:hypothetical protein
MTEMPHEWPEHLNPPVDRAFYKDNWEDRWIGGRSGGRLATPGKPSGGQGGRAYLTHVLSGPNQHFGHGKSKKKNVKNKVKKHGSLQSHFGGRRNSTALPMSYWHPVLSFNLDYVPNENATKGMQSLLPPLSAFHVAQVDIYHEIDTPTPHLVLNYGNVSGLLTGVWPEGHRGKVNTTDAYTHILLIDSSLGVWDAYMGQGGGAAGNETDRVAIPSGQTNNLWFVVFTFVTNIPGIGKRRVVLIDRQAPGSFAGGIQ